MRPKITKKWQPTPEEAIEKWLSEPGDCPKIPGGWTGPRQEPGRRSRRRLPRPGQP